MMDDVERIARAIEPQLDVVEAVDASAQHLRRLKAQRIARVALFAMSAEIDALRAEVERLKAALTQCRGMAAEGCWSPNVSRWFERIEEVAAAGKPDPDYAEYDRPHPAVARATAAEAEVERLKTDLGATQNALDEGMEIIADWSDRATAAEADAAAAREQARKMREALADLLSWFPDAPQRAPVWVLKAGEQGSDDAIAAARAVVQGDE